jgi:hypothetical protein
MSRQAVVSHSPVRTANVPADQRTSAALVSPLSLGITT